MTQGYFGASQGPSPIHCVLVQDVPAGGVFGGFWFCPRRTTLLRMIALSATFRTRRFRLLAKSYEALSAKHLVDILTARDLKEICRDPA